jgi:hypothetical protein
VSDIVYRCVVLLSEILVLTLLFHFRRDLVAMTSTISSSQVAHHVEFYCNLLNVVANQLAAMEQEFFEDIEYSGDNFFVPAIKRLCFTCSQIPDERVMNSLSLLSVILSSRFPSIFESIERYSERHGTSLQVEQERSGEDELYQTTLVELEEEEHVADMGDESDDDNGPVIVPSDDVAASMARLKETSRSIFPSIEYSKKDRETYRFLFAAKLDHEDILMTCARILDDANDVSLVREASAYLEEVEAKRNPELNVSSTG